MKIIWVSLKRWDDDFHCWTLIHHQFLKTQSSFFISSAIERVPGIKQRDEGLNSILYGWNLYANLFSDDQQNAGRLIKSDVLFFTSRKCLEEDWSNEVWKIYWDVNTLNTAWNNKSAVLLKQPNLCHIVLFFRRKASFESISQLKLTIQSRRLVAAV